MAAKLMTDVTTDTSGSAIKNDGYTTFQAAIAGTGAVSVTVNIEVSNDNVQFVSITEISLAGTTTDTFGVYLERAKNWAFLRATTSSISGTAATVNVSIN